MNRFCVSAVLLAAVVGCQDASSANQETEQAPAASVPAEAPASPPISDVAAAPTPTPDPADAPAAAPADGAMLDPDQATREQLLALPNMNAQAADAIIAGRPHKDMLGVDRALASAQLSADQRKAVYARLWKPLDLNKASGEEILLIPGVGARMRHEFEEYRPYRGMEQFRREIGKYVDKAEVARLEQYVAIR